MDTPSQTLPEVPFAYACLIPVKVTVRISTLVPQALCSKLYSLASCLLTPWLQQLEGRGVLWVQGDYRKSGVRMVYNYCLSYISFSFIFKDRVSLCSPGCPGNHSVDQTDLKLIEILPLLPKCLDLRHVSSTPGSTCQDHLPRVGTPQWPGPSHINH